MPQEPSRPPAEDPDLGLVADWIAERVIATPQQGMADALIDRYGSGDPAQLALLVSGRLAQLGRPVELASH